MALTVSSPRPYAQPGARVHVKIEASSPPEHAAGAQASEARALLQATRAAPTSRQDWQAGHQ